MAQQAIDKYEECLLSAYYNALSESVGIRYSDGLMQMLSGTALMTLDNSPLSDAERDKAYDEVRETVKYAVDKSADTGKNVSHVLGPVYHHLRQTAQE
jgi:hypothetical protein